MTGDMVDDFVVSVFVVCAFVEGLSMFCGVDTGAFGSLWLGMMFSVAGDFGGELSLEVTKLVSKGPVVFGGSSSSFVFISLVAVLFAWDTFESTVSNTSDCADFCRDISLPDDGGGAFSVTLNLGKLLDADVGDVVIEAVHKPGIF